ncbi:MAG: cytochrome c oxidase subunit II [Cucumibacter sp.]
MSQTLTRFATAALAAAPALAPFDALAEAGRPVPGQIGFQSSVTPIMDATIAFHDGPLMWIITIIVILVMLLLVWVMVRYNSHINPTPARFTHNSLVEVLWTVVPIAILIFIAIPSFGVLSDQETMPDGTRAYLGASLFDRAGGEVIPAPELTVKATGNQWYWNYEYVDSDGVNFDSNILAGAEPRLLAVDYQLVVPVDTTVRVQVTAAPSGVIHAFAVPSFGIKIDAVPGRLSETWFRARKTGVYYGQCSELCGKDHAFMPIAVRVVERVEFETWLAALTVDGDPEAAKTTLASLN